ncbi:MAG: ribosome biogenesis GTP-binding protein YihA/YsxC [Peptoniphilus sp.]|jgi:GTP-binding protein|uniref:ribosome biogenesis GTP-binding protein YihA/YsxC n=1 Tax=Peptoniphilus sp. TaxID=1971214 RepID=UPI00033CC5D9|nr:ribosome biogenesis GTP-binding protein YihA/YsxC [Peptoniphilus sp.]MCI5643080.1 ribosome biogenesis GTP-binding protein YihA/YsxC [Peptoniphilus sp.]MDD6653119.1 ribosome biogenesis GTP-binding protein YihA/YsxC [Clostridium sp.]CCX35887.1 probable GTP-binding protein EngB [Clostridium sp. CAG:1000]
MEVVNVEEPICAVRISQYPDDKKNEFLILGRSNVGKSSFINTIINRKNMAKTSSKPGKTQTINFYHINSQFYIVDVPGYGYAQTSKKQIEKFGIMIEEYLKNRQNLKHVFLLVDFRHKPTEDDVLMYKFLKYYNLPVTIVTTKFDKVNRSLRDKQNDLIKKTLMPALGDEIINFSSVTKLGKERVYDIIENYFEN